MNPAKSAERVQESLAQVQGLLEKHRVLEAIAQRQVGPKRDLLETLQHRQNLAELHNRLRGLHPADLAYILEALPLDDRLLVWSELGPREAGRALLEVSDSVRESLLAATPRDRAVALLKTLDPDDLAWLAESIDEDVRREVFGQLDESALSWVRSARLRRGLRGAADDPGAALGQGRKHARGGARGGAPSRRLASAHRRAGRRRSRSCGGRGSRARRTCSRPCWTAHAIAGCGLRSTWSPPSWPPA